MLMMLQTLTWFLADRWPPGYLKDPKECFQPVQMPTQRMAMKVGKKTRHKGLKDDQLIFVSPFSHRGPLAHDALQHCEAYPVLPTNGVSHFGQVSDL